MPEPGVAFLSPSEPATPGSHLAKALPEQPLLPQCVLLYTRSMNPRAPVGDPVLEAIEDLVAALEANIAASRKAIERAREIAELRSRGWSYRAIAESHDRPLMVQLITDNLDRLADTGSRLRRAQARALHDEGLTMDEIGRLFGVTRQRVSAILRSAEP